MPQCCCDVRCTLSALRLPRLEDLLGVGVVLHRLIQQGDDALLAPRQPLSILLLQRLTPSRASVHSLAPRELDERPLQLRREACVEESARRRRSALARSLPLPPAPLIHRQRPLEVAVVHLLRHPYRDWDWDRDRDQDLAYLLLFGSTIHLRYSRLWRSGTCA